MGMLQNLRVGVIALRAASGALLARGPRRDALPHRSARSDLACAVQAGEGYRQDLNPRAELR